MVRQDNMFGRKSNNSGFTIIEVLIVLAIAGLIMVIVFLAVPALQRNSRNTQYKNEARRLLAAAVEFSSANSGNLPMVSSSGSSGSDSAKIFALSNPKDITTLIVEDYSTTAPDASFTTATLRLATTCNSNSPQEGGTKQVALFFAVEDSSTSPQLQCLD